jgi:predicted ATPase/class 3 adenylate cyclase
MSQLPTGTVSLLFSDIEGSTVLLSRLGPSYLQALDGQRLVLRRAWADHGGTELGTEGDSFFVVFPTAPDAVGAAVQAQRELAVFEWPGGEQVRVRMGIHTGSPAVHDGGYVGMDVHRAARIAGAAHGGQVVMSDASAKLAGDALPAGVDLRDLGSHLLKDLPRAEHLFQLNVDGLRSDFPALKSLGAASSLPRPATPLVGRDGELAELSALLSTSEVRLVTLTGPGGAGKTRLTIGMAHALTDRFPDGVYFVPLAAVTAAEVMWTTLAEVLNAPSDARNSLGLLASVAHSRALLVLDNLEQLTGADDVVAQLLDGAARLVIVATSRSPLAVPGEHVHPVPPLELPETAVPDEAATSGAVQLFVQHARMVRPGFQLTASNTAEVTTICRRLDGLPLAIELAAARIRLLSPAALLARLDQALDIAASGTQGPTRQRTLRSTLDWSYRLLAAEQQRFFRCLGIFAAGADLDALAAVCDVGESADPLERVADLLDASLVTVSDAHQGEPRIGMLETIRAYARDELRAAGELEHVHLRHARHYVTVTERLQSMATSEYLEARHLAEIDLDNFRAAMTWATSGEAGGETAVADRASLGLRLSGALGWLWASSGYVAEGRRWCEAAVDLAGGSPSPELAHCLGELAYLLSVQGHADRALQAASEGVTIARTSGGQDVIARALGRLGNAYMAVGDLESARQAFEEALTLLASGHSDRHLATLANLAIIEHMQRRYDRAEELWNQALIIGQRLGNVHRVAEIKVNMVSLLDRSGRVDDAHQQLRNLVPEVLELDDPGLTTDLADVVVDILVQRGDVERAARLSGAAAVMRERDEIPHAGYQEQEMADTISAATRHISREEWEHYCQLGRSDDLEDLLTNSAQPETGHRNS